MTDKPIAERFVDLARAINAIDFQAILRASLENYNREMAAINQREASASPCATADDGL